MTLENQVVSLDLAKRLKELGFKQDSLFYWLKVYKAETGKEVLEEYLLTYQTYTGNILDTGGYVAYNYIKEKISAYTVAELGEMLPKKVLGNYCNFVNSEYCFQVEHYHKTHPMKIIKSKSEADARAKMLIYLKENNLI